MYEVVVVVMFVYGPVTAGADWSVPCDQLRIKFRPDRPKLRVTERLAHTLKGVAGNIGAKSVQATAGVVEKLIREKTLGAEFEAARKRASEILEPLVGQLRVAFGTPAEAPAIPAVAVTVDPERSREAATRLNALLMEFDSGATDFVEENRTLLQPLFTGGRWTEFEKLVQAYDFAEAQAQVEEVLKKRAPL